MIVEKNLGACIESECGWRDSTSVSSFRSKDCSWKLELQKAFLDILEPRAEEVALIIEL